MCFRKEKTINESNLFLETQGPNDDDTNVNQSPKFEIGAEDQTGGSRQEEAIHVDPVSDQGAPIWTGIYDDGDVEDYFYHQMICTSYQTKR